ncbi:MAG: hypothetical protein ACREAE_07755 [Nitrosopumilaceae archaeon]
MQLILKTTQGKNDQDKQLLRLTVCENCFNGIHIIDGKRRSKKQLVDDSTKKFEDKPTNENIYSAVKEILATQRNEWKRREEIEFKVSELQKQLARIEEKLDNLKRQLSDSQRS